MPPPKLHAEVEKMFAADSARAEKSQSSQARPKPPPPSTRPPQQVASHGARHSRAQSSYVVLARPASASAAEAGVSGTAGTTKSAEEIEQVIRALESKFGGRVSFYKPGRRLVSSGSLHKISWSQPDKIEKLYFFLFTDQLVYAGWEVDHYVLRRTMPIDESFAVQDIVDERDKPRSRFRVVSSSKTVEVFAKSTEEKSFWLEDLAKAILDVHCIPETTPGREET